MPVTITDFRVIKGGVLVREYSNKVEHLLCPDCSIDRHNYRGDNEYMIASLMNLIFDLEARIRILEEK